MDDGCHSLPRADRKIALDRSVRAGASSADGLHDGMSPYENSSLRGPALLSPETQPRENYPSDECWDFKFFGFPPFAVLTLMMVYSVASFGHHFQSAT
jgi:hypothetical protein